MSARGAGAVAERREAGTTAYKLKSTLSAPSVFEVPEPAYPKEHEWLLKRNGVPLPARK